MKKYRPSNGTEGMIFYDQWCNECVREIPVRERGDFEHGCQIYADTQVLSIDEEGYPEEWTYDKDGEPCCTAFEMEAIK